MRYLSLFSGFGGLDMAVEQLWPDAVCVAHCENNKAASTVLAARWPDVPNLHDVTTADWTSLGDVDAIVGGFPCQDISHAGKRAGITEETRSGLWFHFRDAIRTLRPGLVLVENVSAIAAPGGGLDVVLGSLAEIGFDAECGMLRASDVGAPHRRERWFAVAWPSDADCPGLPQRHGRGLPRVAGEDARAGVVAGHDPVPHDCWGEYGAAITRWERIIGRPAPDPTDVQGRLSADFVEFMMGWPDGWSDDLGLSRADRLKGGGNGVVTLQAVAAYPQLLERAQAVAA